jgi:UDP-N-acetyl-D-mannosaminuronate dehydrogenase
MADLARKTRSSPDIFLETRRINDSMPHFVADKILQFIKTNWSNEKKVKIYLIGFAFKGYPETSDMRKSPTINVLEILQNKLGKKADFSGYDPIVKKDDIEEKNVKYLHYQEGFKDAHCVLLMNNNYEFAKIDIFGLLETMKKPGFLFDGWNFFNPKEISRVRGIIYQGLGGGL